MGITVKKKRLADYALVSTGESPVDNLFDGDIEIEMTNNGFIKTDTHLRTSVNNIWAIGDVVGTYACTQSRGGRYSSG